MDGTYLSSKLIEWCMLIDGDDIWPDWFNYLIKLKLSCEDVIDWLTNSLTNWPTYWLTAVEIESAENQFRYFASTRYSSESPISSTIDNLNLSHKSIRRLAVAAAVAQSNQLPRQITFDTAKRKKKRSKFPPHLQFPAQIKSRIKSVCIPSQKVFERKRKWKLSSTNS